MLLNALLLFLVFIASIAYILLRVPLKKLPTLLKSLLVRRLSLQPASGSCGDLDGTAATAREQQWLQKRKERPTMSAERRAEMKRVFATFDRNRDGLITRGELRESLRGVGISVSDAELEEAVTGSDADGDGCLNLDEFCSLLESISTASGGDEREAMKVGGDFGEGDSQEAELKEAFDVFDRDRDGVITVEELRLVLSSLGMREGKRTEECEEMIRKVDVDGDGRINFDEFKRMMMGGGQTLLVSA
ncbi:hypothetical protein NL676_021842 [Syzygium grande]|nr:hypothetical protein NL676_021842 [Syzygium grande]